MPENRAVVNGATAIGGSTLVGAVVVRCHPPRTCVAARPVAKTPPCPREDLRVQSLHMPRFLSTPSLTAMLLRTATNSRGTAVRKLQALNSSSLRLAVRTAWKRRWQTSLSVLCFSSDDEHRVIATHPRRGLWLCPSQALPPQ